MKRTYSRQRCSKCNNRLLFTGPDFDQAVRTYLCETCDEEYEQDMDEETGDGYGDVRLIGEEG